MTDDRIDLDIFALRRMAAHGLERVDIEGLLEPIAALAQPRRSRQFRLLFGCAAVGCIPLLNWAIDGASGWPMILLSLPLLTAAAYSEYRWVDGQFGPVDSRIAPHLASPEIAPLVAMMAEISGKRLLLYDGTNNRIDHRIGSNHIGLLLLSSNAELRRLVRLPGGGFLKGPFSVREITARKNDQEPDGDQSPKPNSEPEAAEPLAAPSTTPLHVPEPNVESRIPEPAEISADDAKVRDFKSRAGSSVEKRRHLTDPSDQEFRRGLERYLNSLNAPGETPEMAEMRRLGITVLRREFLANMTDDYTVADGIKKAADAVNARFGRIRLSEDRDTTGDLPNPNRRQKKEDKPDSWLHRIAYGTNTKLNEHLAAATSEPQLALDTPHVVKEISLTRG